MEVLGELNLLSARALLCSVSDAKSQREIIRKDVSNFCTVKAKKSSLKSDKQRYEGTSLDRSLGLLALEISLPT